MKNSYDIKGKTVLITGSNRGIVSALKAGKFHLFPDAKAKELWGVYERFARNAIENDPDI